MLEKKYGMEFGHHGFLNGVPVLNLHKKKKEYVIFLILLLYSLRQRENRNTWEVMKMMKMPR